MDREREAHSEAVLNPRTSAEVRTRAKLVVATELYFLNTDSAILVYTTCTKRSPCTLNSQYFLLSVAQTIRSVPVPFASRDKMSI